MGNGESEWNREIARALVGFPFPFPIPVPLPRFTTRGRVPKTVLPQAFLTHFSLPAEGSLTRLARFS
jgi:hypothetical protein